MKIQKIFESRVNHIGSINVNNELTLEQLIDHYLELTLPEFVDQYKAKTYILNQLKEALLNEQNT